MRLLKYKQSAARENFVQQYASFYLRITVRQPYSSNPEIKQSVSESWKTIKEGRLLPP